PKRKPVTTAMHCLLRPVTSAPYLSQLLEKTLRGDMQMTSRISISGGPFLTPPTEKSHLDLAKFYIMNCVHAQMIHKISASVRYSAPTDANIDPAEGKRNDMYVPFNATVAGFTMTQRASLFPMCRSMGFPISCAAWIGVLHNTVSLKLILPEINHIIEPLASKSLEFAGTSLASLCEYYRAVMALIPTMTPAEYDVDSWPKYVRQNAAYYGVMRGKRTVLPNTHIPIDPFFHHCPGDVCTAWNEVTLTRDILGYRAITASGRDARKNPGLSPIPACLPQRLVGWSRDIKNRADKIATTGGMDAFDPRAYGISVFAGNPPCLQKLDMLPGFGHLGPMSLSVLKTATGPGTLTVSPILAETKFTAALDVELLAGLVRHGIEVASIQRIKHDLSYSLGKLFTEAEILSRAVGLIGLAVSCFCLEFK
ncbi:hypothetical protein KIPB_001828, partial [Kipferlia bialata]